MRDFKLLLIAVVAVITVLPLGAHPGPERHPFEQELLDVGSELRDYISALERRIDAMMDSIGEPDEQAVADAVQSALIEPVAEMEASLSDLRESVESVIVNNGNLTWGLIGGIGVLFLALIGMFGYFKSQLKKTTFGLAHNDNLRQTEAESAGPELGEHMKHGADRREVRCVESVDSAGSVSRC